MNAPRRWLDDSTSATPFERDLLRTGLGGDPPREAQAAVWASILAELPIPAGGSGDGGSGAAGSGDAGSGAAAAQTGAAAAQTGAAQAAASGAGASAAVGTVATGGLLKSVLIGAGSALALVATYSAVAPTPAVVEDTQGSAVSVVTTASASPVRAAPLAGPAPPPASAPEVPPSAGAPPTESSAAPARATRPSSSEPVPAASSDVVSRETRLLEESQLLSEARAALRRGDAAGSLSQLDQLRARFPGGVLGQEREALAIEALYRSGRRADAAARAEAFVNAHPTSPLAARVQSFLK